MTSHRDDADQNPAFPDSSPRRPKTKYEFHPSRNGGKKQPKPAEFPAGAALALNEGLSRLEAEAEKLAERIEQWRPHYQPVTAEEHWLFETMVAESLRLDCCRQHEAVLRAELARRARLAWHDDRQLAAEDVGSRLAASPARTVRQLHVTAQGCEWLLERWRALDRALADSGAWTAEQTDLAFDLLGVPRTLRGTHPWDPADPDAPDAPRLVRREIERLERAQATIYHELDDAERVVAEMGIDFQGNRSLAALRRYEASCHRRMLWARTQLEAHQGAGLKDRTTRVHPTDEASLTSSDTPHLSGAPGGHEPRPAAAPGEESLPSGLEGAPHLADLNPRATPSSRQPLDVSDVSRGAPGTVKHFGDPSHAWPLDWIVDMDDEELPFSAGIARASAPSESSAQHHGYTPRASRNGNGKARSISA